MRADGEMPDNPLMRGDGARHAGAVRVRRLVLADRAVFLRDHAGEVGVAGVDHRVDHGDGDVGAARDPMHVGDAQLLENVLRRVALLGDVAARGGSGRIGGGPPASE